MSTTNLKREKKNVDLLAYLLFLNSDFEVENKEWILKYGFTSIEPYTMMYSETAQLVSCYKLIHAIVEQQKLLKFDTKFVTVCTS